MLILNALDQYLQLETSFLSPMKKLPGPDPS